MLDRVVPRQLLAEAVDDEQRVVDRDPEPDQLDEVRDVGRHHEQVRDAVDDRQRAHDRRRGEQERHRRREGEPEHGEQDEERDRQGDALSLAQVLGEDRVEVVRDRGLAAHVRLHPA